MYIITLYISGLGSDNMQNLYYTTYTTREILLAPTMSFHILLPAIGSGCHQVMGGRWWWLLLVIAGGVFLVMVTGGDRSEVMVGSSGC